MSAIFSDGRQDAQAPKHKHAIEPRCGSCDRLVSSVVTLPVSGLRRCEACARPILLEARWYRQGFCEWPRQDDIAEPGSVAPQPSLPVDRNVPTSQPTVYRPGAASSAHDSKRRAAGDEGA